jgi:hypothetical protein
VTYNLEFKLPSASEHFHLPINPAALDIHHDAAAHSKIHQAPIKPKKSKVPWTEEEDIKLLQMWNEGRSWEYILLPSLAGVKGPSGCAVRQNSKSDLVQGPVVLELEEGPIASLTLGPISENVEPSSSVDRFKV